MSSLFNKPLDVSSSSSKVQVIDNSSSSTKGILKSSPPLSTVLNGGSERYDDEEEYEDKRPDERRPDERRQDDSRYERKDERRDERRYDEEDEEEEDDRGYKLSNLIGMFNKNAINLQCIFTYNKKVMFLILVHDSFNYVLYIPSKYQMNIDRNLGIATYELTDDEEEKEVDTLFYNRLPIESLRRTKASKVKSLHRFLPLVTESPIKMFYIDELFLAYITRSNEVDSLMLMSPFHLTKGYYYMTDLQFFFKNLQKLGDEFSKFERALNDAVYDRLTTELDTARVAVNKAQKMLTSLQPKQAKKGFHDSIAKLTKYLSVDKHKEKAKQVLIKTRNANLNKMFEIENVTYVMKEFK